MLKKGIDAGASSTGPCCLRTRRGEWEKQITEKNKRSELVATNQTN